MIQQVRITLENYVNAGQDHTDHAVLYQLLDWTLEMVLDADIHFMMAVEFLS